MSTRRFRVNATPSPTELANQLNRIFAGIAQQFDTFTVQPAKARAPAPAVPAFEVPLVPPETGGGTSIPPTSGDQLVGDVNGLLDSNVVSGIQTIPILKPTVNGTVATYVASVPDIEWKTPSNAAVFLVVTLPFASSPYSATLSPSQITLYLANSSAGADFIFNLPAATGSGEAAIIKKMDANAHNIAVTPNGADTIDTVNAAVNVTTQFAVLRVIDSAAGAWSVW